VQLAERGAEPREVGVEHKHAEEGLLDAEEPFAVSSETEKVC